MVTPHVIPAKSPTQKIAGGGLAGKGPNSDAEPVMGTLGEGGVGRRVSELGVYVRNGGVPCIFKRSTILQTAVTNLGKWFKCDHMSFAAWYPAPLLRLHTPFKCVTSIPIGAGFWMQVQKLQQKSGARIYISLTKAQVQFQPSAFIFTYLFTPIT